MFIVSISSNNFTVNAFLSFLGQHFPYLCSISVSMNSYYDKEDAALLCNSDWYFLNNPTCLTNLSADGQMLPSSLPSVSKSTTQGQFPWDAENLRFIILPPSLQIMRFVHLKSDGKPQLRRSVVFNDDNTIRSTCRHLKHIKLDGNVLRDVYLDLSNHTRLETLSLRYNKMHDLGNKFTTELDDLFRVKTFSVDIRNNTFICSCASLDFIRWVQTTKVDLVERHRLTCLLNDKLTSLVDVDLTDLTAECSHKGHVIVASIIIVFLGVAVVLTGLVWNRWYIKYRIILCNLSAEHTKIWRNRFIFRVSF